MLCVMLCLCAMAQRNGGKELVIPQKNGTGIYGILSNPQDNGKHGVAIICHGFNGTHHFGRDYFKTLNELGYAVYTFDFPYGSVHSRSDNNTMNMSIMNEKQALKDIVTYFQKQKDIDKKKIVLIGESQGGLVSALAAADLKKQVSNLVLIYPAFCIPDNWNDHYPMGVEIPDTTWMWRVPLGRHYFEECRTINVYKTIAKYQGPVLLIHGTDDKVVPLEYSKKAEKTYKNAELKVIDKAGHGFKTEERKVSNKYVHDFLK